jgi:GDP-L-fucose synthase
MKVLVTGSDGLVGMNLRQQLKNTEFKSIFFSSRKDTDLCDISQVFSLFERVKPDYVIHLASIVGGLFFNRENNEEILRKNDILNNNFLDACEKYNVKFGIFILSTCIFPDELAVNSKKIPMNEDDIHKGLPHSSNIGYATSKRNVDIRLNESTFKSIRLIPSNLYGPFDLFDPVKSHVIPALIYKFNEQKEKGKDSLCLQGSKTSTRQFVYVKDLCRIIIDVLENRDKYTFDKLIVANDCVSIGEVVDKIRGNTSVTWSDTEVGQIDKVCKTKHHQYFENFKFTPLDQGLHETIQYFTNLKTNSKGE